MKHLEHIKLGTEILTTNGLSEIDCQGWVDQYNAQIDYINRRIDGN